jgi:hypothetical protein
MKSEGISAVMCLRIPYKKKKPARAEPESSAPKLKLQCYREKATFLKKKMFRERKTSSLTVEFCLHGSGKMKRMKPDCINRSSNTYLP